MTIVNMVGGGGDPEEISLSIPVLEASGGYSVATSTSTSSVAVRTTTFEATPGTVIIYPEQNTAKISVTAKFNTSSSYTNKDEYNRLWSVQVTFSQSDIEKLNAIYDAWGGGFYMVCNVYPVFSSSVYGGAGKSIVSYYTKGLESVYTTISYRGPSAISKFFLAPVGVYC